MTIRPATADDAAVREMLRDAHGRDSFADEAAGDLLRWSEESPDVLMLYDPDIPVFVRFRWSLTDFAVLGRYPFGVGPATQLTYVLPFDINARNAAPIVAEGFELMGQQVPRALDYPVWSRAEVRGVNRWQRLLGVEAEGRFIWMPTMREARDITARFRP